MNSSMDLNELGAQVLEELKAGKSLFGKDGALAPLLGNIINAALEGEMDAHLSEESRQAGNRRNGKMRKQVQTPVGEVTVSTPRDRDSSFDPQFIKMRETMLAEGVALPLFGSGPCHCLDGCHPLQSHGRERLCRYPCHL